MTPSTLPFPSALPVDRFLGETSQLEGRYIRRRPFGMIGRERERVASRSHSFHGRALFDNVQLWERWRFRLRCLEHKTYRVISPPPFRRTFVARMNTGRS